MELVFTALESVPPKSTQLLCISSLSDVATLIREREELFISKVKEVVVIDELHQLFAFVVEADPLALARRSSEVSCQFHLDHGFAATFSLRHKVARIVRA